MLLSEEFSKLFRIITLRSELVTLLTYYEQDKNKLSTKYLQDTKQQDENKPRLPYFFNSPFLMKSSLKVNTRGDSIITSR